MSHPYSQSQTGQHQPAGQSQPQQQPQRPAPPPTTFSYPTTYHPSAAITGVNSQNPYQGTQPTLYHPHPGAGPRTQSYASGVSGYGHWGSYPFYPQHAHTPAAPAPQRTGTAGAGASTPRAQPLQTRFSVYGQGGTGGAPGPGAAGGGAAPVSYAREPGVRGRRAGTFRGMFHKDLKNLMYGFGDDRNPANDTVNVMEEILIEFITDVCQTAGGQGKRSRLSIDDLRRALSRPADAKKLARMEELLFMQEDIKRARAQFPETDLAHKEF